MMGLHEIRDLVSSMFIMLNQKTYVLFRIEFLVVLVTVMFLAMFIMDIFRPYIHNAAMKAIFSIFNAVSDSIVVYLLGAMQTAPFKNQLFPVWALVLVSFRYSVDFITGYGVPDRGGRRFMEWRNVVNLLGSAFLNMSRGSRFAHPLWLLWALQILRSWYRFHTHTLASNSIWHGRSSGLISEYMRASDHDTGNWKPEDCNPETMEGYKYLVYGETKQNIKLKKPRYVLYIDSSAEPRKTQRAKHRFAPREGTTNLRSQQERSSMITLDKIWQCPRHLLQADNQGKELKNLSLAFALSRLLRCRLEGVPLQGDIFQINRNLVKRRIIEQKDAKCALGVMERQLAFVNDYFNTRYPMVFWNGFYSLFWNLLFSVVTFGVVCWLAVDIRRVYNPPEGELAHVVQGFNVDMIITWVFMFFMMFKEIWEMVSYLLSDWTRLLLVCRYAQWKNERTRSGCMESTISSFFTSGITAKRWHGHIDQYFFLESYDDRPRFWNLIHKITTGMVPNKDDGAKLSSAIDVPDCVRTEILEKIRANLKKLSSLDLIYQPANPNRNFEEPVIPKGRLLRKDITSLSEADGDRKKRYGWASFDLPTCSHIILVWHIATSLCEIKLAKKHGVNLRKPGLLCSFLSCFTNCCSVKSYLVDEKKELVGKLQETYITANSLSRYCAYLLVSKPDLIPDSFLVPKMVFQETVAHSYDDILKNCDSLQSRYDKLMEEAEKAAQDADNIKKNGDALKLGAMLGKELIDNESEEVRWVILAGVWTELLIHMAPTWNAEAHKKCLSGGEFITHIWALLWHCGIQKSTLWREEVEPENNASAASQDNNVGNDNDQAVDETREAGADMRNDQIAIKLHEADEVGGTKEHEASNLRRGPRRIEGTGSSEIEETYPDATAEAKT